MCRTKGKTEYEGIAMDGIIVAVITGGFSFVTFLLTRYFTVKDTEKRERKEKDKRYQQIKEEIEGEKERVEKLEKLFEMYSERQNQNIQLLETVSDALQATLRNEIIKMYKEYYENKHFMPIYERENLSHMAQKYYSLGGNGVIPGLVEKLFNLSTEPENEEA